MKQLTNTQNSNVMKLYDKVNVLIQKSPMNKKMQEFELTVCRIEKDENGNPFWGGWTETGKVRYFTTENIIK